MTSRFAMSETAAFDELAREFFGVWFRFHPDAALRAGVADFGALLPAQADDDHAALGNWLETLIVALEEFDYGALDPERQIDLQLMFALARVEHREMLERDWRHRDPVRFLPLTAIHYLTLLSPEGMRDALSALLTAVPSHLRLALAQLKPMAALVPAVLVQESIEAAEDGRRYLRVLCRSRWLRGHCHGCGELEAQAETAGEALRQYAAALRREIAPVAAGKAGCGSEHLGFLLRHRHLLDVDPSDCGPLLDVLVAQCEEQLAVLSNASPATVPEATAVPRPASEAAAVRDLLRAECEAMAERVECGMGISPPTAPLRIAGGPACPRSGSARIDYVPDLGKAEGLLYIPDGDEHCTGDATPAEMRLRCSRLGWGGRHTLTFGGGMAARSLPRRLAAADTLSGGWALYQDRRLFDLAGDDAEKRAALRQRHQAIVTARVDLDLHRGSIDTGLAAERLQQVAAAPETTALHRLAQVVRHPGAALAEVLGWQLIEAAASLDGGPEARVLHQRLLGQGPIPLALALREALGETHWQAAWRAAGFGAAPNQVNAGLSQAGAPSA